MPPTRYQVVLHAVAPDGTDAGSKYADTALESVSEEQLRKLLTAFATLTARLPPLVTPRPEIRIRFPAGQAMIAPVEGKLFYTSWDIKGRGIEVSVDDIMAVVAVAAGTPKTARADSKPSVPVKKGATGRRKFVTIGLLGAAIVVMNLTTAWMLLKPPHTLLPPHVFLPDAESDALMNQVAGAYQTGPGEGDRHLVIEKLGLLRFAVYGKNRTLRRESLQSARGVRTPDGLAIITNENGVLRLVDPNTVTVYGDTYRRVPN